METEPTAVHASLSEMFDGLEDAVSVVDRDLRLIYVNDAFCTLVGWNRPILLGATPPMPWWIAGDHDRATALMRQLLEGAEIAGPSEERVYKHRTGREVPVGIRSSLLRDAGGAVTALVAFVHAVGDGAEEAGDALRAEREHLARAEEAHHLAAETTAARVHELAQSLAVVRDEADALMAELGGGPHQERARAIVEAAAKMDAVTHDLLAVHDTGSTEVTDLVLVDLAPIAMAGLAEFGREADRRGVRLRGDLPSSVVVKGDSVRLRQMVDGMLRDALGRAPQSSEVRMGLRSGGGWAVLEIEDRGPGLDPAAGDALAAPGWASVARSVARAHGGELDVVDVPAGGRVLRLTLPLGEDGP